MAARAISTLPQPAQPRARLGLIEQSPANGVRVIASENFKRRLSAREIRHLGKIMMQMDREGEHPTGPAAIRAMLLTGFRRMEILGMRKEWIELEGNCVAFPDTKSPFRR